MSSNNDLVGCPACKGRKTVLGLGSFTKDCDTCKGIGWIEKPVSDQDVDDFLIGEDKNLDGSEKCFPLEVTIKKKPGRKPKIKVE